MFIISINIESMSWHRSIIIKINKISNIERIENKYIINPHAFTRSNKYKIINRMFTDNVVEILNME